MSLGYETFEDTRDFEQKGLTGEVKRFTTSKMEYPCIVLNSTEENPIKVYKLQTVKGMIATSKVYNESLGNSLIHLYFRKDNQTVKVGVIRPSQVKSILTLFEDDDLFGYLDSNTILEGFYLYVLAE